MKFTYNEWCKMIMRVWESHFLDCADADADVADWYPLEEAVHELNYAFELLFEDNWENRKMRNLTVAPEELFEIIPFCVQIFDLLRENFEYYKI